MPSWSGIDSIAAGAFETGFGIALFAMAILFAFLIGFVMVKKLLSAAGL
jgi:hypothetical protein